MWWKFGGERARQNGRARDAGDQPRRCAPTWDPRWRGRARVQRPRGVFRRRGYYGSRSARGRSALLRRLVRPGERGRERALRAWQRERVNPRSGYIAAEPGPEFGDGTGGSGTVYDAAARQSLRAGAVSGERLTRRVARSGSAVPDFDSSRIEPGVYAITIGLDAVKPVGAVRCPI